MTDLPKCGHRTLNLSGTWQADKDARVMCTICGADTLLDVDQVRTYERLYEQDRAEGVQYLAGLIPE